MISPSMAIFLQAITAFGMIGFFGSMALVWAFKNDIDPLYQNALEARDDILDQIEFLKATHKEFTQLEQMQLRDLYMELNYTLRIIANYETNEGNNNEIAVY